MQEGRLYFFVSLLTFFMVLELLIPQRKRERPRWLRWYSNLGVVAISSALVFFLLPVGSLEWTQSVTLNHWGLLNLVELPTWLHISLTVVLLDLAIYWQHRIFHAVPVLWRFHKMHHTDVDLDVTSGLRFHPVEILLSMLIKLVVIYLIGASLMGVLIFEVLLNGMAMFNHSNIRLPVKLDTFLRRFVVTPDMHKVHHSVKPEELNRNFGFNLSLWDYVFKSYKFLAFTQIRQMPLGIGEFRDSKFSHLHWLLVIPFVKKKAK